MSRSLWPAALLWALIAAVVNVAWYLGTSALGVSYQVTAPGQPSTQEIPVALMGIVSFVAVLLGALGLWLLRRFSWGVALWRGLVIVAFLVSLASPITGAKATSTIICLIVAHTVVAVAALVGLTRPARSGG